MRWSLRTLVMGGYAVATLALTGAAGYAIYSIERLAGQSELMLAEGVYTTRLIEQVQERIPDLQRVAQQLQVRVTAGDLATDDLLELYEQRHGRLVEDLRALAAHSWEPEVEDVVLEMRRLSEELRTQVSENARAVEAEGYSELRSLAVEMREAGLSNTEAALATLRSDVDQVRNALLTLAVVLTAVAVLFAAAFSRLVSRPIDQIGAGIRSLGQPGFDEPIHVGGPTDLQAIGRLLDWLRERLNALEEQKVTFVRQMSHELKTPLANIREGSELLCEELSDDGGGRLQELAAIVRDNGVRLHKQIDGLFNFATWHDDRVTLPSEPLDLAALLDEVLADYRLELGAHGIEIDRHGPRRMRFTGDRKRMHSLLDNLISNAVKYSPPGGTIRVVLESDESELRIDVRDEGPGIPEEQREKVFLPFFQGEPPLHARVRGTGIGLSVARACVEAHGGFIEIVDDVETGAHFRVRLPRQAIAHAN